MKLNQILTSFVANLKSNNLSEMTPEEQRYNIELLEQRIMFSATQLGGLEMPLDMDVMIPDEPVEIFGNNRSNDIVGTELDEIIFGRRGNDYLDGGEGNDILRGGRGDDTLSGGTGNDELRGGRGNDILNAGTGNDAIYGGRGYDTVHISGNSSDYQLGTLENGKYEIIGKDGSILHIATDVEEIVFLYDSVTIFPDDISEEITTAIPIEAVIEGRVVEAPVVEAPVVEAPVVEAPVVEVEEPVVDEPIVEAPIVEVPVVEPSVDLLPGDSIADGTVIADGSTVNVTGGSIGLGVDLADGILNVESGSVALGSTDIETGFTSSNSEINISGGTVGGSFQLLDSSVLTISGGEIESFGVFGEGAIANITGGVVTRFPDIFDGGVVNISGGDIFSVRVFDGGEVNFTGTEFFIDGTPIALTAGEEFVITDRDVNLSGTLADGSFFETDLNTTFGEFLGDNPDGAGPDATVTVTIV